MSLLVLTAAVATGCSAGAEPTEQVSANPGKLQTSSIGRDFDFTGAHFTVGSKEFTEQVILSKIVIHALKAAGAQTSDQTGLAGSTIARNALQSSQIDMYWEYAGTGWSQFLQHDTPVPGDMEQYRATAREDARNGIEWLGPARFGNQYAIARAANAPGPVGQVNSLSELARFTAEHPDQATLCGASEFLDRELEPLQQEYGIRFPSTQVYQNAFALNYVNVAKGSPCNFAEVFTTDARLKSLDLQVLSDEKTQFSSERAALTVRSETSRKHPELAEFARRIGNELTEDTMIRLNGMVDLQGATPDEAAKHFLRTRGFTG
ncbi:glycine betaine ABC transporter substrate-binding protein [Parasphingorhabdus pacifica]